MKWKTSTPSPPRATAAKRPVPRLPRSLLDLAYPPRCRLCFDTPRDPDSPLCDDCADQLERERAAFACPTCGRSARPEAVADDRCGRCRGKRPAVSAIVRVGQYTGHLGRLITAYKYEGREELEPLLGRWLATAVRAAPWRCDVQAVVAVPTHWRHRIGRPFYAADALTAIVVHETGLPTFPILRRVRGGPHQIGLSHSERLQNVRGAFALRRGVALNAARLLIVDDVRTTGATLSECARVLKAAGAAKVYGAVVASVEPGDSDRYIPS